MRREGAPIQTLLLRTFLPAVVIVAMLLAVLVYNWLYASIMDGFDRKLVTTSALTGAMVDAVDHDWLIRAAKAGADPAELEQTPQYRRNTVPMRRILTELDLTYLYSQAFGGSQDIIYVLDGTMAEDHSPPGAEDELTAETRAGLRKTEADGSIYVSPIEYQEQWGLLKTAAAPIHGSDGRIGATAGADVNISVIQVATQNALFASALIGIGSILACLFVAWVIVQRVARPITALKQEALRIAAGDADMPAPIKGPREVAKLRDALAELARQMAEATARDRDMAAWHERDANAALLAGTPMPRHRLSQREAASPPAGEPQPGTGAPVGADTVRTMLTLRAIAPFDTLTESELLCIARHVRFRRFEPDAVLLPAGSAGDLLFIVIEGEVLRGDHAAPPIFDAASALFGLIVRDDYRAGPAGAGVLCLTKPHLFTIARECPDFIVGLIGMLEKHSA
jgi:hypothetical protein